MYVWRRSGVPITVGAAFHGGILAALRNKLVEGGAALQAYRRDPPVAAGRHHGLVCVGRDEGAEKDAGAEMDDSARRDIACSDKSRASLIGYSLGGLGKAVGQILRDLEGLGLAKRPVPTRVAR